MKKRLMLAAAFGLASMLSAAVQNVEITSANAYAYSADRLWLADHREALLSR